MGIPSDQIERARSALVENVVAERGIRLRGTIDRYGPCPRCGGVDRFSINVRKQVFNCRGCGAKGGVIDLVMHIDRCEFKEAITRLTGALGTPARTAGPTHAAARAEAADDRAAGGGRVLASARKIVSEIVPLIGTAGEVYLRDVRKIDVAAIEDVLAKADAIGWHPSVYFNEPGHALHRRKLGCIVAIMTDAVTAEPTGAISRTYLRPDLTKIGKAKTFGAPRGIVRLSPDGEVLEGLHLAEGIETALTGLSWGFRPMWSTGDCRLMEDFPVLSGIEALTVFVDNDENAAGEKAARKLEARRAGAGRDVALRQWGAPGDLNDALRNAS